MNSKRRAELQRKLSMGPVARPPADLAERIKADIPKYLQPEAMRFAPSLTLSMRVAASLILLITTAVVTMRILQPASKETASVAMMRQERPVPALMKGTAADAERAAPATEEVRLEIEQQVPASSVAPLVQNRHNAQPAKPAESDARQRGERRADAFLAGTDTPAAPPPPPPAPLAEAETVADAVEETKIASAAAAPRPAPEAMPVPPPAAPVLAAPPLAAPPPMAAPQRAENITVTAEAPLVSRAYADSLDLAQKKSVFGISIDPQSFTSIKTDLENGKRPAANHVNVDALVNYFAGAPARAPRRDVNLEVEASPAPVKTKGNRAILRFTIDTARVPVAQNASTPPIAIDAKVAIDFNERAVASYHRVGDGTSLTAEPILLHNVSVTGLYEVELKPKLSASQRIATVRLTYRNVNTGREQTMTRVLQGRDLVRDWSRASRRHRLASLGAVWSETLRGAAINGDVARQAAELAAQNPSDARARDLADVAKESGGGM